jgi:hypothetical protein
MCSTSSIVPVAAALAMEVDRTEAAAAPPESWMKRRRFVVRAMEGAGLSLEILADP